MDSQQPRPAPPPFQPTTNGQNPYEFITNPARPLKKSLLGGLIPGGSSKKGRIIIVGAGALVLIFLIMIIFSLISSGDKNLKQDYLSLAQQQTELIRISEIGVTKARQADAKNLAVTTKYSLSSQQSTTLGLAKKAGAKTDSKSLALGKNSATDTLLTSADQTNQFDEVFIKTMQASLQKYQQTLKKIYDASNSKTAKNTLSKDYDDVRKLVGGQ